jgi:hypothetical protein
MERQRDFEGCVYFVCGLHLGRARAAFYATVTARLATFDLGCDRAVDQLTVERATDIMAEVAVIYVEEGTVDGNILDVLSDTHDAVLCADKAV